MPLASVMSSNAAEPVARVPGKDGVSVAEESQTTDTAKVDASETAHAAMAVIRKAKRIR